MIQQVGFDLTPAGVAAYKQAFTLKPEEVKERFEKYTGVVLPKVKQWLGVELDTPYKIVFSDVDEYWQNWVSTDDEGNFVLQFNINKRIDWLRGADEKMPIHEVCGHVVQNNIFRHKISQGQIRKCTGLTMVFVPLCFEKEGLCDTLAVFYPENLHSPEGLLYQEHRYLHSLVWNNVHLMANEGKPMEEVIAFYKKYYPINTGSDEAMKRSITQVIENPLLRTYQFVYGPAEYTFHKIAEKLTTEQKREFAIDMYNNMYTPSQILAKYPVG